MESVPRRRVLYTVLSSVLLLLAGCTGSSRPETMNTETHETATAASQSSTESSPTTTVERSLEQQADFDRGVLLQNLSDGLDAVEAALIAGETGFDIHLRYTSASESPEARTAEAQYILTSYAWHVAEGATYNDLFAWHVRPDGTAYAKWHVKRSWAENWQQNGGELTDEQLWANVHATYSSP